MLAEAYHLEACNSDQVHSRGCLGPKGTNQNLVPYMDPRKYNRDARGC